MLLVIPVSKHDKHLIGRFKSIINKFPIGTDHDLLVIGSKENQNEIEDLERDIKHLFLTSKVHLINDNMLGYPMACNYYFQQTCAYLKNKKDHDSFFWFELDSMPLKSNWLDSISNEYYLDTTKAVKEKRNPKIFLGVKERNYEGKNGDLLPESISGQKMSSVGVYSTEICNSPVLSSLSLTGRHWTSVIQWYIIKELNDSKLIQNNWRTNNYKKHNDSIVCDSISNSAWDIHYNKPINNDCVVIHGCKDESLFNLLLNNNKNNNMNIAKQVSIDDAEDIVEEFEEKQDRIISINKAKRKNRLSKKDKEQEE